MTGELQSKIDATVAALRRKDAERNDEMARAAARKAQQAETIENAVLHTLTPKLRQIAQALKHAGQEAAIEDNLRDQIHPEAIARSIALTRRITLKVKIEGRKGEAEFRLSENKVTITIQPDLVVDETSLSGLNEARIDAAISTMLEKVAKSS